MCRSASDDGLYGFITEVSHDQNKSQLKLKDWGLCLEDTTKELEFKGLFRSEVISEVAKIKIHNLTTGETIQQTPV